MMDASCFESRNTHRLDQFADTSISEYSGYVVPVQVIASSFNPLGLISGIG
jgi:hypothetical protein